MKKYYAPVFYLLAFLFFSISALAVTRFVKPTASGTADGLSWANASASLQDMINASANGDEVWVASGTYLPTLDVAGNGTPSDNRNKTFLLKSGVSVYGGFAGTETTLAAGNWTTNTTILSGDLGSVSNINDNAYHVVLAAGLLAVTNLDGFTITGGNVNKSDQSVSYGSVPDLLSKYGGGILASSSSNNSNLRIDLSVLQIKVNPYLY